MSVLQMYSVPSEHSIKFEDADQNSFLLLSHFTLMIRYTTGHIWACPPSEGDDYIFHCHPPDQRIPQPKRLQEWYKKMLDKAVAERIVHDYKVTLCGNTKDPRDVYLILITKLADFLF